LLDGWVGGQSGFGHNLFSAALRPTTPKELEWTKLTYCGASSTGSIQIGQQTNSPRHPPQLTRP
jgi:hypothetical protein